MNSKLLKLGIILVIIWEIFVGFDMKPTKKVFGQGKSCGNGVCQTQGGGTPEDCSICPQDCGACPIPTNTPTPTENQEDNSGSDGGSDQSQQQNNFTVSSTPTPTPIPSDPPIIQISFPESPTDNKIETIVGSILPKNRKIGKSEISTDGGGVWTELQLTGNTFSYDVVFPEDGAYEIIVRVSDIYGNTGITEPTIVVFDSLPPVLGGAQFSYGTIPINPVDNTINFIENTDLLMSLSTRGGVTDLTVGSADENFTLQKLKGTQIFQGNIKFTETGTYLLKIKADDGVNDQKERDYVYINIVESGRLSASDDKESTITIYYYDSVFEDWFIWNAASYGQQNPHVVKEGKYAFILPPGSYYLEVNQSGGRKYQSNVLNLSNNTILNADIDITGSDGNRLYDLLTKFPFVTNLIPPISFDVELNSNNLDKPNNNKYLSKGIYIDDSITIQNESFEEETLSSHINKPTLITYVSSWSTLSREQLKLLSEISQEYINLDVLVVSSQESTSLGESIKLKGRYAYTPYGDKNGLSGEKMMVSILPQHFIVNSQGYIVDTILGRIDKKEIMEQLKNLD